MPQRLLIGCAAAKDEMLFLKVKASQQAGLGTEALRIRTPLAPQYTSARSNTRENRAACESVGHMATLLIRRK